MDPANPEDGLQIGNENPGRECATTTGWGYPNTQVVLRHSTRLVHALYAMAARGGFDVDGVATPGYATCFCRAAGMKDMTRGRACP